MYKLLSNNYKLAILSGLLLIPGWYEWGTGMFMLLGFIPILQIIENFSKVRRGGRRVFLFASLAFLIWNAGTTWWITNASFAGMLAAFFLSTLLMSIPVWLSYKARKVWGQKAGLFAFVVFWMAFEYSYLHAEISWPWLTLGNGFAYEVRLIQWYDLTGALGGSLWVLIVNVLFFQTFFSQTAKLKVNLNKLYWAIGFIILPILFSIGRYYTYKEDYNPQKIIVVQPNVDPYLKFNDIPSLEQTQIQIDLARAAIDSTIDYVVAPETSINNNIWIGSFDEVPDLQLIKKIQSEYSGMKYITGITCYKMYEPNEPKTPTAKQYGQSEYYYDSYNSAIQIDSTKNIPIYHKSQLVTGVEKMPYPGLLNILKPLTLRLGGTFRSHGTQKYRDVFTSPSDSVKIAPVICYESIFGDYVTDYIKLGAGLIFVITNDGWWGDTPGHRQHNSFSSIRAIETRRSIARSANTGISCFINQRGDVLQKLTWWKRGTLTAELNVNTHLTFFVKHGDYLGRIAFFTAIFLILFLIASVLKGKK
jgi:apolipoprotein N-acyltransferase